MLNVIQIEFIKQVQRVDNKGVLPCLSKISGYFIMKYNSMDTKGNLVSKVLTSGIDIYLYVYMYKV